MWNAEIKDKSIVQGELIVNVLFSNGTEEFNEVFNMRRGEDLNGNIISRLSQIEALTTFTEELELGAYTPLVKEIVDIKEDPLIALRKKKELVDLGVIKATDPDFVEALANVKDSLE